MPTILRIEHPVPDYDAWKRAFDDDPIGRSSAGVQRYRIMRPVDDAERVMIDLEFGSAADAEAMLGQLRVLWSRVQGTIVSATPDARVLEVIETTTV